MLPAILLLPILLLLFRTQNGINCLVKSGLLLGVLVDEMEKITWDFQERTEVTGGNCFPDSCH